MRDQRANLSPASSTSQRSCQISTPGRESRPKIETSLFTPTDNALPCFFYRLEFNLRSGRVAEFSSKPNERCANWIERVLRGFLAASRVALLFFLCFLHAAGQANS